LRDEGGPTTIESFGVRGRRKCAWLTLLPLCLFAKRSISAVTKWLRQSLDGVVMAT